MTGRVWALVARRDFWVRLRERSFIVSTLINLIVISILIVLRALSGGGTPGFELAVVGTSAVADRVAASADAFGMRLALAPYEDAGAARDALAAGEVDAVLEGETLTGLHAVAPQLTQAVQAAAVSLRIERRIEALGGGPEDVAFVGNAQPVAVGVLSPGAPDSEANAGIAFIVVILLYGQLFGYGVWVASGVIEEKASRVVELLLATIRARQLMAGKILGIGVLGLLQLTFIASFAIGLGLVTGAIELPASAVAAAAIAIGYFILGFAFYASLFAVAGSLVTRMEELQNALVPINLFIFVSFFISIGALADPDGTLVTVASVLPGSSALAMPVRIVLGAATPTQIVLSLVLSIGATAALIPASGRLYAGAVLRTGARVKLRDAWRAAA
ncbi:MAG TPA: ABC transporter permease [Actinomycetota bacterium]|nr:ABC transporter permease [Actinomycetota bacterium]